MYCQPKYIIFIEIHVSPGCRFGNTHFCPIGEQESNNIGGYSVKGQSLNPNKPHAGTNDVFIITEDGIDIVTEVDISIVAENSA